MIDTAWASLRRAPHGRRRPRIIIAALLLFLGSAWLGLPAADTAQTAASVRSTIATPTTPGVAGTPEQRASAHMETVRDNPLLLRAFLWEMPKGGDIHNHLAGAVYAEDFVAIAARHGLCVDVSSFVLSSPPCNTAAGRPSVADNLTTGAIYNGMINAWSMREFLPGTESGHDHFFNSFGKFGLAAALDTGDQLASVASHAASQNEQYLELMHTVDGSAAADLGSRVGWDGDLAAMRGRLMTGGMDQIALAASKSLDEAEAQMRADLGCETPAPDPGCNVTIRYLYQAVRTQPPERVFAQFVLGFQLAQTDPRVVGINLVAPEDDYVALRDYTLQMSMLDELYQLSPDVNISLHAGELVPGLVAPENLRFHIRQAIELGHAKRIGHGTSVMEEDDPFSLLDEMRDRDVLVEISLFSSRGILGIEGLGHPILLYMGAGVPVALATDDEGVSRSDLTGEYALATQTFGFRYEDLKRFARESLEHSFLPGPSLWRAPEDFSVTAACAGDSPSAADLSDACQRLLAGSERARLQWRLEGALAEFENGF